MTPRPRLRLTLPPLSPRDALTLSSILDTIDDLLWRHYGDAMVALLTEDTFVPGACWSARRDQPQSRTVAALGRIPRHAPRTVLSRGKEVEPGDVKKRER